MNGMKMKKMKMKTGKVKVRPATHTSQLTLPRTFFEKLLIIGCCGGKIFGVTMSCY
jgi:hypothetical protein